MEHTADSPCIMVIFGGTGDLTHRKLIPALYNLRHEGRLSSHFAVVAVGRRDKTHEEYRNELYVSAKKHSRFKPDDEEWRDLEGRIYYYRLDFPDAAGYPGLKSFLADLDEKYEAQGNAAYYMAVAPEYFEVIVSNLGKHDMALNRDSWQRLVVEKPFGENLETARYLNRAITDVFEEKNVYRLDHYLGKEMIQNIMVIRFANPVFESIWNGRYIDNIQISSSETVGCESRGGYYEKSGALRDMVQNHMLQLLALTAMEPPISLETEAVRDEKVKVLRSLELFTAESAAENIIRGQYGPGMADGRPVTGYREEDRIAPDSGTETFIAMKLHVKNFRWGNTPFYLRTGKRLSEKTTEIVIEFKALPEILYARDYGKMEPNLLVIRVQPREGMCFLFNAKKPGTGNEIVSVNMDFCQNCMAFSNSPEAYERLIFDVIRGDSTLFTRWDEIESSWRFVDSIASAWQQHVPGFPNYAAGTWGPAEADGLLEREGRKWWNV